MKNPGPAHRPADRRRVLIANEEPAASNVVAEVVISLGFEPLFRDLPVTVGTDNDDGPPPDVALVGRWGSDALALEIIHRLVHDGACPVVARLPSRDPDYVAGAARAGAFGFVVGTDGLDLHAAIDLAVARFHQYRMLQEAFLRRAVVEQAKGILMARHGIDQDAAFDLLRAHSRRRSRKVADVAAAVVESHLLLRTAADEAATQPHGVPA
jgi:ANTAR domain